jgi:protease-4
MSTENQGENQGTTVVIRPTGVPLLRFAAVAGWVGLIICFALLMVQWKAQQEYFNADRGLREQFHSGQEKARNKVAIIRVSGVIAESDGYVKRQIDRVRQDERVKAVVLRVDSPGGTITASDYLYHHLKKLKEEKKIPLVVSMGSMAASGGYYVSMAVGDEEKSIFAEPTTWTGSIGVLIPHYDISGLLEEYDIKDDTVASHPRKLMLSMTRPMSEEDRQILQGYVDEALDRFKGVIKQGRPFFEKDEETLDALATGEIFTAEQARTHGLIDKIGFIEEAIARVIELTPELEEGRVRVIEYKRPTTLVGDIVGIKQAHAGAMDASALLDLTAPRAYYLATWLPAIVRSRSEAE